MARLVEKNEEFYCSECMMRQKDIESVCFFCGKSFSNWEEILVRLFDVREEDRRKNKPSL